MSLYDDIDTPKEKPEEVAGWASGIKLLHSQLQLKKATQALPNREKNRKSVSLAPVVDLKSRKEDDPFPATAPAAPIIPSVTPRGSRKENRGPSRSVLASDPEWVVDNEYDPFFPNDYEKVIRDLRDRTDPDRRKKEGDERENKRVKENNRHNESNNTMTPSGFARVPGQDEEEEDEDPTVKNRRAGAAIAPPPSLQQDTPEEEPVRPDTPPPPSLGTAPPGAGFSIGGVGGTIAAKIMAKYGYKEGQGLGKSEQGIATALQVEKTSKRGGRIIQEPKTEAVGPEVMKNPSKVVLLMNMVGPGQVDAELEPEVREECSTKYGEVTRCLIFEIPTAPETEAVRIFVEFKRQESAIKAIVDLNGRYFGGRLVKACFYSSEKLNNLELAD